MKVYAVLEYGCDYSDLKTVFSNKEEAERYSHLLSPHTSPEILELAVDEYVGCVRKIAYSLLYYSHTKHIVACNTYNIKTEVAKKDEKFRIDTAGNETTVTSFVSWQHAFDVLEEKVFYFKPSDLVTYYAEDRKYEVTIKQFLDYY